MKDEFKEACEEIGYKPIKFGKGIQKGTSLDTISVEEMIIELNEKIKSLEQKIKELNENNKSK